MGDLLLLLSLLLVDFMLELGVMLPTLLEQSMLPRRKLKLMPTILEDMVPVLDMLVLDMLVLDILVLDMPDLDMPTPMLLPLLLLLLAKSVSLPLPPSTLLVLLLLLSLLLVDFMLELDVMLPTLLEQSMLPRGKLKLMPTILEDMVPVLDMLVLDMLVLDMLALDMPDLDMPTPMLLPLLLLLL